MEKIITKENFRSYAYCNMGVCKQPIVGVAVSFFGLGASAGVMHEDDSPDGIFWGKQGVLYVQPYHNPWAWMNRQTVAFVDEILDVVFEKYNLPAATPLVYYGCSMGGQGALVYTAYAKRQPTACLADCPVCNMPLHYNGSPTTPRTMYSAFAGYEGTLQAALESASPLHLIGKLPKTTQYVIYHGERDTLVNIKANSQAFVAALQAAGYDITYHVVPGGGHCDMPPRLREAYYNYALQAMKNR